MAPLWQTGLQTDFYLLVVAAVYHADGLWGHATFDLYPRSGVQGSNFVVAAGMHEAAEALQSMSFPENTISWMKEQPAFARASEGWWESLRHFRFSGDIHAVAEGTVIAPGTPMMRVTAPLQQATLIQTRLLQLIPAACGVATRAAQCSLASKGKRLYEFSSRRSPSGESAIMTSRAAIVGGFYATSNGASAASLGVPVMGTLSSDFFAAYGGVGPALASFALHFPDVGYVNLPAGKVDQAVAQLAPYKKQLRVVRLDHPQLARAARALRPRLDAAGMKHVRILGSGSLDAKRIQELGEAPVDLLAVGKHLLAGGPVPCSYRIAEMWRGPEAMPSTGKGASKWPGCKQVLRRANHDLICLESEIGMYEGEPLLEPLMVAGEITRIRPEVGESRGRCLAGLGERDRILRVSEGVEKLKG